MFLQRSLISSAEIEARQIRDKIRFRYGKLQFILIAQDPTEKHNGNNGRPVVAAGHVACWESAQFAALPLPLLKKKGGKTEQRKRRRGRRKCGGIDGDDDGSDSEGDHKSSNNDFDAENGQMRWTIKKG